MGYDQSKIDEIIWQQESTKFFRARLASTHLCKTRFDYWVNSKNSLMHIRAIQGHTGGNMSAPELMGHVAIPHNWKEFVFHLGCSFNIKPILETRLIARGRESKEGRQTIFLTLLSPLGEKSDEEEPSDDLSVPRKVHYYSKWKHDQDAVYWVKCSQAKDQGLQFWRTKSNTILVHDPVPADCIYTVISQTGDRILFERLNTSTCTTGNCQE